MSCFPLLWSPFPLPSGTRSTFPHRTHLPKIFFAPSCPLLGYCLYTGTALVSAPSRTLSVSKHLHLPLDLVRAASARLSTANVIAVPVVMTGPVCAVAVTASTSLKSVVITMVVIIAALYQRKARGGAIFIIILGHCCLRGLVIVVIVRTITAAVAPIVNYY